MVLLFAAEEDAPAAAAEDDEEEEDAPSALAGAERFMAVDVGVLGVTERRLAVERRRAIESRMRRSMRKK